MRKIFVSNMVSLDGFIAGPNGDISWFLWDEELQDSTIGMMRTVDTILFGRVTYEMMASYWPNAKPPADDPLIIDRMNNLPKVVFSKTLKNVSWNNTILMPEIDPNEITMMKEKKGKDIAIFGSGQIVSAMARLGLIDEYRLIVNPVILGSGISMFGGIGGMQKVKLVEAKPLKSGNVILTYQALGVK